jgi:hypothetical protein
MPTHHDSDSHKGAVETESPADALHRPDQSSSLSGQLPHRGADSLIKNQDADNDTDFPEPGRVSEHSGQHD